MMLILQIVNSNPANTNVQLRAIKTKSFLNSRYTDTCGWRISCCHMMVMSLVWAAVDLMYWVMLRGLDFLSCSDRLWAELCIWVWVCVCVGWGDGGGGSGYVHVIHLLCSPSLVPWLIPRFSMYSICYIDPLKWGTMYMGAYPGVGACPGHYVNYVYCQ